MFKNVSIKFVTQFPVTATIVTMSTADAASKAISDPLTDLPPITVKLELVLQHLVQAEVDWDDPLKGGLRGVLMKLRIEDLQHFLTRKNINIKVYNDADREFRDIEKTRAEVIQEDTDEFVEVIQESDVYHEETTGAGDIVEFNKVISKIDKETFSDLDDHMEEECAEVIESRKKICL